MLIPKATLRVEVTVEPSQGNTGDGETYGTGYQLKGSLNRNRHLVRAKAGDTLKATAVLLLRPDAQIKVRDRVREGTDTFIVEKVAPVHVGSGVHHLEVWLA